MPSNDHSLAMALAGKRVGLSLCARFFGFYGHAGLLLALEEQGLSPAAYAGTSAGAIVAALAGAGVPPREIAALLTRTRRTDFWDPVGPADLLRGRDGRPSPGLLRGERFHALLRRDLSALTFEACPRPVLIEALNLSRAELEVLHQGDLPRAVWASCAYPGLFQPVRLGDDFYWDGGLVNKAPVSCLTPHVDAILIHWLSSESLRTDAAGSRGLGLLGCLTRGIAVARRETARLQAEAARATGLPVYVVSSVLPRSGPLRMHRGGEIIEASRTAARRALESPARLALLGEGVKTLP